MPNPTGSNGGLHVPGPVYGDVKRQAALLREAPMSGSPVAVSATEAPRRARRAAARGGQAAPPPPQQQAAVPVPGAPIAEAPAPPSYGQQLASLASTLASQPGAGPNLAWLAQQAQAQAASGG